MDDIRLSALRVAHEAARDAWAGIKRKNRRFTGKSPVDGLAERIRRAKAPTPLNPARKAAQLEALKRDRTLAYQRSLELGRATARPRGNPDAKYWPHQGPRECARRRRQVERLAERQGRMAVAA